MTETTEANVLRMPARERREVDGSNAATVEPASVELLPGVLPSDPAVIPSMCEDEKRYYCALILMKISGKSDKIGSLFQALPEELRARALIELVLSEALDDHEVGAILYGLMTDMSPEWRRMFENCPPDDEADYEAELTEVLYDPGSKTID
jgi:hypothetical protein